MAVVVTGAAGFLGRHLVAALLARGERVVAVDRRPTLGPSAPSQQPGLLALRADLLHGDDLVTAALHDADAVFHLAGCPGVRDGGPAVERQRHRDNVLATERVLAAVPLRTPLVVTSSSSVYGGAVPGRPSAEADAPRPRGGYARSKVRAERLCARRQATGGAVAVARPFTVAGEGQRCDMALARWLAAARAGEELRVYGDLRRTRDITDVRDVTRVLLVLADRAVSGPVNVGTGVGQPLSAMIRAVGAAVGADEGDLRVVQAPASRVEPADTRADTRRLARLVGFVPRTDLVALVARQAAAAPTPARGRTLSHPLPAAS